MSIFFSPLSRTRNSETEQDPVGLGGSLPVPFLFAGIDCSLSLTLLPSVPKGRFKRSLMREAGEAEAREEQPGNHSAASGQVQAPPRGVHTFELFCRTENL